MQKKSVVLILFFMCIIFRIPLVSDEQPVRWSVGEELVYKVKWSFLRLGTIRAQISDTVSIDGQRAYHIRLFVDSNPTLFFVSHHAVYETFFDDTLKVFLFRCDEKIEGVTYHTTYRIDHANSRVHIDMTDEKDPTNQIIDTTSFHGKLHDGTSLLYYARAHVHNTKMDTLRYMDDGKVELAIIDFQGPKGSVKIGSLEAPVPAYYLEGHVMGGGIAGLKGDFKGWFARDGQRPPLKAKMKVFVGSVTLELESWKRWEPPKS